MTEISARPVALIAAVAVTAALSGCAAGGGPEDPYEATNRAVHEFNKSVDRTVLRPAGQAAAELPLAMRAPIINFSDNAGLPGAALNGLLQGDIAGAATNTMRFLINSTVGVLGLADPAGAIGIEEVDADFGQTLAVWGVGEGAYLELPFLGPSTQRDAFGRLVDFVIDPLDSVGSAAMSDYGTPAWAMEQVIDRGTFGATVDSVLHESADSYAQTRLLYLQNRRYQLGQGAQSDYLDPYGDDTAGADPAFIDPYEAFQ